MTKTGLPSFPSTFFYFPCGSVLDSANRLSFPCMTSCGNVIYWNPTVCIIESINHCNVIWYCLYATYSVVTNTVCNFEVYRKTQKACQIQRVLCLLWRIEQTFWNLLSLRNNETQHWKILMPHQYVLFFLDKTFLNLWKNYCTFTVISNPSMWICYIQRYSILQWLLKKKYFCVLDFPSSRNVKTCC